MHGELGQQRVDWRSALLELPQPDDGLSAMADEQSQGWKFPDNRPAVATFTDLMIAALEAVLIQHELRRLRVGLGDVLSRQAV